MFVRAREYHLACTNESSLEPTGHVLTIGGVGIRNARESTHDFSCHYRAVNDLAHSETNYLYTHHLSKRPVPLQAKKRYKH